MMKSRHWDWVILLGVLCFLAGGVSMALGYLGTPWQYAMGGLGLILIGAGTSGKRRAS